MYKENYMEQEGAVTVRLGELSGYADSPTYYVHINPSNGYKVLSIEVHPEGGVSIKLEKSDSLKQRLSIGVSRSLPVVLS